MTTIQKSSIITHCSLKILSISCCHCSVRRENKGRQSAGTYCLLKNSFANSLFSWPFLFCFEGIKPLGSWVEWHVWCTACLGVFVIYELEYCNEGIIRQTAKISTRVMGRFLSWHYLFGLLLFLIWKYMFAMYDSS